MTNEEKDRIALFRYGIISELVSGITNFGSKDAYFKAKGEIKWIDMDGKPTTISEKTAVPNIPRIAMTIISSTNEKPL